MRSLSPMRTKGLALVASAVVAAGGVYLSHDEATHKHPHHRHAQQAVAIAASPSPDVDATPTALPSAESLKIYASAIDGHTMIPWKVRLGEARDIDSVAYLAAVKAVAGPADIKKAIRFPAGTTVRSVHVAEHMVTVDLSTDVETTEGGGFTEIGEFKALVWTMTDLPNISRVRIRVGGATVPTLPGGHLELDEPLTRSDF